MVRDRAPQGVGGVGVMGNFNFFYFLNELQWKP